MMGVEVGRWVGERQCMHWDVVHEGLARTVYIICTPYMTVRHIRCVYMVLADPIIFGISPGQRYCLHTVCTYGCVQPWKHVILARRGCCVMVSYSKWPSTNRIHLFAWTIPYSGYGLSNGLGGIAASPLGQSCSSPIEIYGPRCAYCGAAHTWQFYSKYNPRSVCFGAEHTWVRRASIFAWTFMMKEIDRPARRDLCLCKNARKTMHAWM